MPSELCRAAVALLPGGADKGGFVAQAYCRTTRLLAMANRMRFMVHLQGKNPCLRWSRRPADADCEPEAKRSVLHVKQSAMVPLFVEVVFGHTVAQRVPGHFEESTGFRDIARRLSQCFFKHLLFHILKRQSKSQQRRLGALT